MTHQFKSAGRCVWCGIALERVRDRKAAPDCPERPDNAAPPASGNPWAGY